MHKRIIAAPSFVWPADIPFNCRQLKGLVGEVGLLFFESTTCLAYTDQDLPTELAETGLRYHVHLPLDLPWSSSAHDTWEVVCELRRKVAFLKPWGFVLHPPPIRSNHVCPARKKSLGMIDPFGCLRNFSRHWKGCTCHADLLLENTRENDLVLLWPLIQSLGLSVCLDLGHLLAYGQITDSIPGIWPHVRMVHLNAPGPNGTHLSLKHLDRNGLTVLANILERASPECVLMVEVFDPASLLESLEILHAMGVISA